ncbi:MAG: SDR family NAD(P)-dependent oxidoreductase [Sandaracinaceae bacterium]
MSLLSWVRGRHGANGFGYASSADEVTRGLTLTGKRVLVTGANSGLGFETARALTSRGATVLVAARSEEKAEATCKKLGESLASGAAAIPVVCELSEPTSAAACAEQASASGPIDALILNAGIMALPKRELKHGHELQFLTNHIGHFVLTTRLLDALTPNARVVVLSSAAHAWAPPGGIQFDDLSMKQNYTGTLAYGQSKLANLLFAKGLAKRFEGTWKTANAVHPGVIATNLGRHLPGVLQLLQPVATAIAMKSIPQGAATQCYVAVHPDACDVSGEYFADCNVARSSAHSRDEALADRLWDVSEAIAAELT